MRRRRPCLQMRAREYSRAVRYQSDRSSSSRSPDKCEEAAPSISPLCGSGRSSSTVCERTHRRSRVGVRRCQTRGRLAAANPSFRLASSGQVSPNVSPSSLLRVIRTETVRRISPRRTHARARRSGIDRHLECRCIHCGMSFQAATSRSKRLLLQHRTELRC